MITEPEIDDNKKTRKACDHCRARKVKCDGEETCARCLSKGYDCTYNYVFKKRLRKKHKELVDRPKRKRGRPRKSTLMVESPLLTDPTSITPTNNNSNIPMTNTTSNIPLMNHISNNLNNPNLVINGKEIGKGFLGVKPVIITNNPLSTVSTPASAQTDSSTCTFNNNSSNIDNHCNLSHNHIHHHPNNSMSNASQYMGSIPNYSPPSFFNNPILKHSPNNINLSQQMVPNMSLPMSSDGENSLVEQRLQKMESMISILLDKVSNQGPDNTTTISNGCTNNNSLCPTNNPSSNSPATMHIGTPSMLNATPNPSPHIFSHDNAVDTDSESIQKWIALLMHTSLFFLSPLGLKTLERKMEIPEAMIPLRKIVNVSTPFERRIISIWTNPVLASQLSPLPSRYNIECLLKTFAAPFFMFKVLDIDYLKHLLRMYCDFRDGLIPEPQFSYSDYLLMNTSLLIACLIIDELSDKEISDDIMLPDFPSMKAVTDGLLDNSLFYYSRLSVISGGLSTIVGALFLSFYADSISLSRAAYLISTCAIRQAQEMGLHIEETYRTLSQREKTLRLNIWWTCYVIDKELCIRWGQSPVINDNDITAPAIPGFEAFWSPNDPSKAKMPSKRSIHNVEIQEFLESMMDNPALAIEIEQYITIDYSFLISKVYTNFLRAGALKNIERKDLKKLLDDTITELDYWRTSIPKAIRPITEGDDEQAFYNYIQKLKSSSNANSLHLMIMATALHVRYHHVKLMIFRAYTKHCIMEYGDCLNEHVFLEPILSARSILKISCLVDSRFGSYVNYFIFYPFNAFLAICGLYINLDKPSDDIPSDLQLLVDCIKLHFTPFISNKRRIEKGGLVELVLRGMLYATYVTCEVRFGEIPLEGLEIFDDIKDIANGTKTAEDVVYPLLNFHEVRRTIERPVYKMPYFENPAVYCPNVANNTEADNNGNNMMISAASPLKQGHLQDLIQNDVDRTPNVSFLLSPANQMNMVNGDTNTNQDNNTNENNNTNTNPNDPTDVYKSDNPDDKNPFLNNNGTMKADRIASVGDPDYFMNDLNSKDTLFQNMLNIPNYYFFDYMGEDTTPSNNFA